MEQYINRFQEASSSLGLDFIDHRALFCIIFLILILALRTSPLKKAKQRWRVTASKKWLRQFRENWELYTPYQKFNYVSSVDHFLWEEIILTAFEERKYKIQRTPYTRDNGSDGFVTINGLKIVIQAKRYKRHYIAGKHIVELELLVKNDPKLHKGLFVHTGKTSKPNLEYFKKCSNLELLSGVDNILKFLNGEMICIFGYEVRAIS